MGKYRSVRRALPLLLVVLTLVAGLVAVTAPSASAASVDRQLSRTQCALTGRVYVDGGCSRVRCLPGAFLDKKGRDAELCARPGRAGAPYGQPINSVRCRELGRVWIGPTNICASNPYRTVRTVRGAPQCADPRATYVNHREEEGYFDECLSPNRVRKLGRVARKENRSLPSVALDRGRANCSYRGGWVMTGGVCVQRLGPPPASDLGGVLMTGDSVSWRAWDDLHAKRKDWELDLRPGRRLDELAGRLEHYRRDHGDPARLIIQLGTNRRNGYTEADFRATMATVPAGTPVMFLLPFRHRTAVNRSLVAFTKRYEGWMRTLAASRPQTCLAEWPSYAAKNLDKLADGEHPDRQHEGWYARYVLTQWAACESQLGL